MNRAGFYIDGFNFYHGLCELNEPRLKWMSFPDLARLLVRENEAVEFVKIFSATPNHDEEKVRRHLIFHKAQIALGAELIEGKWKSKTKHCKKCKKVSIGREEKESDVNFGIHLVHDAHQGRFDVAYLVTCDSDIAPAARLVRDNFPGLELVSVNSPNRPHSRDIRDACARTVKVKRYHVQKCLLPEKVIDLNGSEVVDRPSEYI